MIFGFGKKKSAETMLAELGEVGICLRNPASVDALFRDWTRADIEKSGFELLLCAMGDEQFDPNSFHLLPPLSDDVWHFDFEAIEDHGIYSSIVKNCCRLSGGDLHFDDVADFVEVENGVAWVELTIDGASERIDLKVDNDWTDPRIFEEMENRLAATDSSRKFAMQGLGQDCLLICKTPEQTRTINRLTGLSFGKLHG